jgi:dolichyl-phosphate-mannose-protein mannosyltransferase
LVGLLALSFVVRFLLFPTQGYVNDLNTFAYWFNTAADHCPRVFYSVVGWCDYPPFNVYFFWGFGSIARALSLSGIPAIFSVIKLLPNLFDMATAFLIYVFVRKRLDFKAAMLATALYAFNPAVIFNAAVWGQLDAIYTFFLVLSLMLVLASKPELSAAAFTLSVLTKPQAIALAPLIAYLILRQYKVQWLRSVTSLVSVVATVFVVIIPFEWSNPLTFLRDIYFNAYNNPIYKVTSLNAFNVWALQGMWIPDTKGISFLTPNIIGWAMFAALTIFTLYLVHKRMGVSEEALVLFAAFVLLFGFFMLPTRIHERYLFPVISMLALMFPFIKKARPLYAVFTATLFVNISYVLYWLNADSSRNLSGDPVALAISVINLIAFLYVLVLMWGELKGRSWLRKSRIITGENGKAEAKENEHQDRPQ